jgi:nicotinate-nucleotide adenylyltransferase
MLILGGSFNPIHHGHLICARAAAEVCEFDKITLMPTGQPPHKTGQIDVAPPFHRVAMARLAIQGDTLFAVDDRETRRPGASFTIDTVRQLIKEGAKEVNWLIGADMVANLPTWRQADALLEEVHFILLARPGWSFDFQSLPDPFRKLEKNVVQAPLIDISATDIRRRVAAGKSIQYLTPPAVCDYIRKEKLYL